LAGFVDTTVKDIDQRLRELKTEVSKLEAARAALVGARRGPGRPRGSSSSAAATPSATRSTPRRRAATRRPGRPRGRRGGNTRANQALELVRKTPGIKIPDIAKAMGIEPNYLYRVMPKLESDGQVKRRADQGWGPA
jgi:hypothetical protein